VSERPYSRGRRVETRQKYRRLLACPSWKEAERRLLTGVSPAKVAEFLIERGEYMGVDSASIERQLQRYLKDVPATRAISRPYIDEKLQELTLQIDEVREMELLIVHQMQRIGIDSQLEVRMKKLLASQRAEIQTLFDMLERLAKFKQEIGIYQTAPKKFQVAGLNVNMTLREALEAAGGELDNGNILRLIGQAFAKTQERELVVQGPGREN
jgi:hypothetical protein